MSEEGNSSNDHPTDLLYTCLESHDHKGRLLSLHEKLYFDLLYLVVSVTNYQLLKPKDHI